MSADKTAYDLARARLVANPEFRHLVDAAVSHLHVPHNGDDTEVIIESGDQKGVLTNLTRLQLLAAREARVRRSRGT